MTDVQTLLSQCSAAGQGDELRPEMHPLTSDEARMWLRTVADHCPPKRWAVPPPPCYLKPTYLDREISLSCGSAIAPFTSRSTW